MLYNYKPIVEVSTCVCVCVKGPLVKLGIQFDETVSVVKLFYGGQIWTSFDRLRAPCTK